MLPAEGDVVSGKYRIGRSVGAGAMGYVVAAHHVVLRQNVAIKFLLCAAGEKTERFLREAQAALALQSEHVVRVYDVGELPQRNSVFGDGTPRGHLSSLHRGSPKERPHPIRLSQSPSRRLPSPPHRSNMSPCYDPQRGTKRRRARAATFAITTMFRSSSRRAFLVAFAVHTATG